MNTFSPVFGIGTKKWFHITTFVWRGAEGGERKNCGHYGKQIHTFRA